MKTKKLLSLLMVAFMMLSMVTVANAKGNALLPLNDFSVSAENWTTLNNASGVVTDEQYLKLTKTTQYSGKLSSAKYDTTGLTGVRFDFSFMKPTPAEGLNGTLTLLLNANGPVIKVSADNAITFTDKSAVEGYIENDKWYDVSMRINYSTGRFYCIIKDDKGNVIIKKSFVQSSGYIKNEFVAKADSYMMFQLSGTQIGTEYYFDNMEICELSDEDMAILPLSQTVIVEDNFDTATVGEATLSGGWDYKKEEFGMGGKGIFAGATGGVISIEKNGDSETDKILKLNLNTSSRNYIEVMYSATQSGKEALVNEITFAYEKAITSMDIYYRGSANVATLSFVSDKVYLGNNKSSYNFNFDFVPGKIYTVKTFYVMGESNQGKIEITDGEKSAVIAGDVNVESTATSTEAPSFRFWFDSENTSTENKVITIYNYNLYSAAAEDCKLKYAYSDLKLTQDKENPNKYYASVEVEANTSYDNYVNNHATLILTSYDENRLKGVSLINVSPKMGRFTTDVTATDANSKIKAMLWNMDISELSPLLEAATAGDWE